MNNLLLLLMQEYQRLIQIENEYEDWKLQNPHKNSWEYNGQRVPKSRFKRIGVMIRQTMIDYEKSRKGY